MKHPITLLISLSSLIFSLTSCQKDSNPDEPAAKKNRTVIEYMIADNDLYTCAERDINEMEAAWSDRFDGHMVVFLYPVAETSGYAPNRANYDEDPRLLLISRDNDTQTLSSRVLKRYDRMLDPTDPTFMGQVLSDAMMLAPADNYGLIFWSHGSGWLPRGMGQPLKSTGPTGGAPAWAESQSAGIATDDSEPTQDGITAYSFGQSNSHGNSQMEIDAMARALPAGTVFDFILFDACYMANIEVAWELKDRTKYLIASAAETLTDGFPYEAILAPMFETQPDVQAIGEAFYDYYNRLSGSWRTATVGVVRCDRLPEVATAVRALCDAGLPATGISYAGQQYGRRGYLNTFYDLADFVRRTWGDSNPERVAQFESALNDAVVYRAATPWLFQLEFGNNIQVKTHCGLACYLPRSSTPLSLEAYRTRFGWSTASGMGRLVP